MGRSKGRTGLAAEAIESLDLAQHLGIAWQCDPSEISVGKEKPLARLWAG